MTDAETNSYVCEYCGQLVFYSYPITTIKEYNIKDDTTNTYTYKYNIRYSKSKARYEHELTHKGLLDSML